MFKTYEKYLITKFIKKFLLISLIFFGLIVVLSVLEEISFFKDLNANLLYPYFLTFLGAPITLFEIFPFIFLISTQFLFFELFKKDELSLLKTNGLSNIKIIQILFLLSLLIGLFTITFFYNASAKLKFIYTDIKNNFSKDNKYLAVVTNSGLWLKDEINGNILIVKANYIKDNNLVEVVINKFNNSYELIDIIQSKEIDITDSMWIVKNPIVTSKNISNQNENDLLFKTNFDKEKINSLFSNIATLNVFELFTLKDDYEKLGYSSDEIIIHLLKLFSTPFLYGVLTVLASIIMFNLRKDKSLFFHVIMGILMSVIIYYMNFMFSSLGNNGKIPLVSSIFLPILFISIFSIIGLIRVNEK